MTETPTQQSFEPHPCYPPAGRAPVAGWDAAADTLPAEPLVLALDGPMIAAWDVVVDRLTEALEARGGVAALIDMRTAVAPWPDVVARTMSERLGADPQFERLPAGTLEQLFDLIPAADAPSSGVCLVFGPGAALVGHDVLWYVDLPKRYSEAAVGAGEGRNLGQRERDGAPTTKRLFYVDWPLLDHHRDRFSDGIDLWVDVQDPQRPVSLDGTALRRTIAGLASRPFRTRPTFNSTSWGGHWAQAELGMNTDARNTALGYALIAPESGVLIGDPDGDRVEVPFQLLVSRHPDVLMGQRVHDEFGTSFPVRFDYLDTFGGGNLSVHVHPQADYMRDVFGWSYTQHETYYVMVGGEGNKVFLGLRADADIAEFQRDAHDAHHHEHPFDIEKYVQTFPAEPHQLFMIPAGTPHGSGEGNVVLEVSATPYLYSLRFYDWLRRDADDNQRPVHVDHAFHNLAQERIGDRVAGDLVRKPVRLRSGTAWSEEVIGASPEVFFEVRRLAVDGGAALPDDTAGTFHILTVVEGPQVFIETGEGSHRLSYAETIVVPAAVGVHRIVNPGEQAVRLVKAVVA